MLRESGVAVREADELNPHLTGLPRRDANGIHAGHITSRAQCTSRARNPMISTASAAIRYPCHSESQHPVPLPFGVPEKE
ncbi:MAG: hypothetical protein R6U78_14095 [Bacteroidales bacterium]